MKKLIAVLMILTLMVMSILPAMAEFNRNGGMQGQQPPQSNNGGMNSGAPQGQDNRSPFAKPDGTNNADSDNQTPPAKPEENTDGSTQTPPAKPEDDQNNALQSGSQPGQQGSAPQDKRDPLQKCVDDGKLSQTTYDAIQEYLKNNSTASDVSTQTPPEKPEGDSAAPQVQPGAESMLPSKDILDAMLTEGIITEDEYAVLLEAIAQPAEVTEAAGAESTEESI